MITIIFGPPGAGKTSLMTHLGVLEAFNQVRTSAMQEEIASKNSSGFKLSVPEHCLAANYDLLAQKFGFSPLPARRINPYRLGFKNKFVKTHFVLPHECILIMEAQRYFNSRKSMYYPEWQSRFFEQHRHNNLDFYMDTQRPMLIDVNIRELARFIEIVKMSVKYDHFGNVCAVSWLVREIANSSLFDRYMSSGKLDKKCYVQYKIVANYNVFACYFSQSCKPKFYDVKLDEGFDLEFSYFFEESKHSFEVYLKKFNDEMPENFYNKSVKK